MFIAAGSSPAQVGQDSTTSSRFWIPLSRPSSHDHHVISWLCFEQSKFKRQRARSSARAQVDSWTSSPARTRQVQTTPSEFGVSWDARVRATVPSSSTDPMKGHDSRAGARDSAHAHLPSMWPFQPAVSINSRIVIPSFSPSTSARVSRHHSLRVCITPSPLLHHASIRYRVGALA